MTYPILDAKATGERIKELRKAHHLKVEDIARFMGFESEQAVYKWQRGDSLPTVDNLYALSRLFDTTVDDILRGSKEEDEKSSSFLCDRKSLCNSYHIKKTLRVIIAHSRDWKIVAKATRVSKRAFHK